MLERILMVEIINENNKSFIFQSIYKLIFFLIFMKLSITRFFHC